MKDGIPANESEAPAAMRGPSTDEPALARDLRTDAPAATQDTRTGAPAVTPDPWTRWRAATPARVALGRAGAGLPTGELLRFGWAHAMARDAIHVPLDVDALSARLTEAGWDVARVQSAAADRMTYLQRPDLGRRLDPTSAEALKAHRGAAQVDLCFVIGDGLSSPAIARHAVPLLEAVKPHLDPGLRVAPLVVATQARVALADEVGEICGARLVVMLIGERPGLTSPDSLGIYITHAPRRGRSDAERNCISNVRPEGLPYEAAAFKLMWLVREALQRGCTGIELKDESDVERLAGGKGPPLDGRAARNRRIGP